MIPVLPELVTIFREHRRAQAWNENWRAGRGQITIACYASRMASRSIRRYEWQEWANILKSAGLEHRGVHAQRHTATTLLLDQGVALAVVQEMLGHSDIRVTRGYLHVSSPLTIEAARRMVPCCGSSQRNRNCNWRRF